MLKSKKLNAFFNDCYRLNIQTVIDPDLLSYFYALYDVTGAYKLFEEDTLLEFGGAGEALLDRKDKMIFSAIKEIIVKPAYYIFATLNTQGSNVNPHELLFELSKKKQLDNFYKEAFKITDILEYEKKVSDFINNKEQSIDFRNKRIDKKLKDVNKFIKQLEEFTEIKKHQEGLSNFIKNFITENKESFKKQDVEVVNNLFSRRFSGKFILSIDITKANYQVFKLLNVIKDEPFQTFIGRHSTNKYLKLNKGLRQVIYGNLSSKRLGSFQRLITSELYNIIKTENPDIEIYLRSNDELIIVCDENDATDNFFDLATKSIQELQNSFDKELEFNYEIYQLKHLESDKGDFFYKEFDNKEFEMKGVPVVFYPQVYKKIKGLSLEDQDLMFEEKNIKSMVKFVKPIKFNDSKK